MFLPCAIYGQEKCATVVHEKEINPHAEETGKFEEWLQQKIQVRANKRQGLRVAADVITIPVVVHIIHNGEALGTGINIHDEQIFSQITVLNEDFRRTNADASNTRPEFLPAAADVEIQFALAQRDPEGLPTDVIVRVNGGQSEWLVIENTALKSISQWPPEDYLNIWVTNIGGNFLGYAQFPISTLDGFDSPNENAATDGVVLDYKVFGSKALYPDADLIAAYSLGRTTTHEVGHYLGLRHIWGDDSGECFGSDYVNDTPNQGGSTSGCPSNPESCGSLDMVENYMDYTNDACMNLFTQDQKTRMRTVLDNSPRRASLKNSLGLIPPVIVSNDLGIKSIVLPQASECNNTTTPSIEIRNYGDNTITSAQVQLRVNGNIVETLSLTFNLSPLEIAIIDFSVIDLPNADTYAFTFEIIETNGGTDANPDNNSKAVSFNTPVVINAPFFLELNTIPTDWGVQNPDGSTTWKSVSAPNGEPSNTALCIEHYNYKLEGEVDVLMSPVIDLSGEIAAILSFEVAYARYPGVENESLLVIATTDCEHPLSAADTLYYKTAETLKTAGNSTSPFIPSGKSDWRKEIIDISEYAGVNNIRIAFISKNGFGNNLYLDNIQLTTDKNDLSLNEIISPSIVACDNNAPLKFIVQNLGTIPISNFNISYQLDDLFTGTDSWGDAEGILNPGETETITILLPTLSEGKHTLTVNVNAPEDSDASNNSLSYRFNINNSTDLIPIKEDFQTFSNTSWVIANPDNSNTWRVTATNSGLSLHLNSLNYTAVNEEDWFVSPSLDFSNVAQATLVFDLAYPSSGTDESLKILVSTDCGITYQDMVYEKTASELQSGDFSISPTLPIHWKKETINLNRFIGNENIRIAFVSTNGNSGNIYLDNIQLFVTPPDLSYDNNVIFPNPTNNEFNIVFALDSKETVRIWIYDTMGKLHHADTYPNTLNQTYTFDVSNIPAGVYLIKVVGDGFSYVERLIVR